MNNEPVAWMEDSPELYVSNKPTKQHTIPLYTHPEKTLTNEDLAERIAFLKSHGASERFLQVYEEAVKWAMGAILRKAQEK